MDQNPYRLPVKCSSEQARDYFSREKSTGIRPGDMRSAQGSRPRESGITVRIARHSLHRDALGQISRLVHIAVTEHGDMVGQQLQRDRGDDRL